MWSNLIVHVLGDRFFGNHMQVEEWILSNIQNKTVLENGVSWYILFGVLYWKFGPEGTRLSLKERSSELLGLSFELKRVRQNSCMSYQWYPTTPHITWILSILSNGGRWIPFFEG